MNLLNLRQERQKKDTKCRQIHSRSYTLFHSVRSCVCLKFICANCGIVVFNIKLGKIILKRREKIYLVARQWAKGLLFCYDNSYCLLYLYVCV